MKNLSVRQAAVFGFIILSIIVNIGIIFLGSDQPLVNFFHTMNSFFIPAPYSFSIFALIYLGQFVFGIYQLLPSQKENKQLIRIFPWVVLVSMSNTLWITLWSQGQLAISFASICTLIISLSMIYYYLQIGNVQVTSSQKWFIHNTFSAYLGWGVIVFFTNLSVILVHLGWTGFGISNEIWAIIFMILITIFAIYILHSRRDIAFGMITVWAIVGVLVQYYHVDLIAISSGIALVILGSLLGLEFLLTLRYPQIQAG